MKRQQEEWLQVYLDVGVCRQGVQSSRTLGDKGFCSDPEQLGRIVIGDTLFLVSALLSQPLPSGLPSSFRNRLEPNFHL